MKLIKRLVSIMLCLSLIGALFSGVFKVSAAEKVSVAEDLYYLVNVKSGRYLTLKSNSDIAGANIQIEDYSKDAVKQVFKIRKSGSNYKIMPAESTTRFIGPDAKLESGVNVSLGEPTENKSQAFVFYEVSKGIYSIRSAENENYVLAASGSTNKANVTLKKYSSTSLYQQWKLVKFSLRKEGDTDKAKAYGIDVSYWQGEIDWQAVKEYGVEFVIIRIGYSEVEDYRFKEYYEGAVANGLDVGVYIYSYNKTTTEAKRDAKDVLEWLDGRTLQYPVYYDIEDEAYQGSLSKKAKTNMCIAFMDGIKAGGYLAGTYSFQSWFDTELDLATLRENGSTWLAKWPKSDQADEDQSAYDLWQFRSDGKIAGISGDVDVNVSFLEFDTYTYTGKEIKPKNFSVYYGDKLLTLNKHYKITYENNINAGVATAKIVGIDSYKDKVSAVHTFKIQPAAIGNCTFEKLPDAEYSALSIKPEVTVKLGDKVLEKTDYTVSYSNNKNAGKATVTVKGSGNIIGSKKLYFNITPKSITDIKISKMVDKVYTGSAIKQSISLYWGDKKLVSGTDYSVSYKNNVDFGKATVTIKAKGNFTGSVTKSFKIVTQAGNGLKTSSLKKDSVKLTWGHIDYATRYQLYRATEKNGVYTRIYSSPDRWTYSYTDKDVAEGTAYYYKIRGYKKVGSTNYYGAFSSPVLAQTKIGDTTFSLKYNPDKNNIEVNIKEKAGVGYIVYLYNSKEKKYEKVWAGKDTQYIFENIDKNKTYTVRVRTYKKTDLGTIYGAKLSGKKIKAADLIPNKIEGVKASSHKTKSVKISWNGVEKFTRYQIYRATSKDGEYTRVYSTPKGEDITSYTDKDLKEGTYYFYKVRAYYLYDGVYYYGEFSDILQTKTKISNTTFSLKYNQDKNNIEVNIKEDTSVGGYIVYLYNSATKDYEKAYAGGSEQYIIENIDENKTYSIKIRTYKKTDFGTIYGTTTDAKKIKVADIIPEKVQNFSAVGKTGGKAKLSWDYVVDANYYEVYRSTSKDGTYKLVHTTTSQWYNYFTNTGLTSGKKYYYKVRACKVYDGTAYFGAFSSKDSARAK